MGGTTRYCARVVWLRRYFVGARGQAQNPNLGTLNLSVTDPPTRPEVQQILDQFNALLNQITRMHALPPSWAPAARLP